MRNSIAGLAPDRQLKVVYRPIGSLRPDPRNARTHPKRQIEQLIASIKEFGFTNPVLVDESDVLIAGHGRLRAAKELGLADVPTIVLEGLGESQKKALRLAGNKIALNAGWDLAAPGHVLKCRWSKGESGNPAGRPRKRRTHVSAFDIIFDKTMVVTQNGTRRELRIEEVLELQTYQAALKGSKLAIRAVLKMIEKREAALARLAPPSAQQGIAIRHEDDPRNADDAMLVLGITVPDATWTGECEYGTRMKLATWAAQAALSRPGRRPLERKAVEDINRDTIWADQLRWPRGRQRD